MKIIEKKDAFVPITIEIETREEAAFFGTVFSLIGGYSRFRDNIASEISNMLYKYRNIDRLGSFVDSEGVVYRIEGTLSIDDA